MSFNIFASGVANGKPFSYYRENCIDGDDFVVIELISTLSSMHHNAIGVAQSSAETFISKIIPGSAPDGMGTIAFLEFHHVLKNIIDCLAMCDDASNGHITVFSKKSGIFSDTYGDGRYEFSPRTDPGTEFVRAIGKCLEDTDMNNWGVLRAMVIVLTQYSNQIGQSGKPNLMIQLNK
jgi:hypothetical protein